MSDNAERFMWWLIAVAGFAALAALAYFNWPLLRHSLQVWV